MTTSTTTQICLPGQCGVQDGPVDLVVMYAVHHAFRRDLDAFARAVPATPVDDVATWRALDQRWTRFGAVLHHHHTGEDAGLWPLLRSRVDAADRAVLDAMEAEHDEIDPLLEACTAGFASMAAGGTADERAALAVRAAATRDRLGRHLEHEETEALALVQAHLTQDDWHRMEQEHFKGRRMPLATTLFLIPWVCDGVPDDVRRRAFADAGRAFLVAYRLSRPSYERQTRRAFAHARS